MAIINGTSNSDNLFTLVGNDTIYGGIGYDTVTFNGSMADYQLSLNSDHHLVVNDTNASNGNDGTDTLASIEKLIFTDGAIDLYIERQINTVTEGEQTSVSAVSLKDGSYYIGWLTFSEPPDPTKPDASLSIQHYSSLNQPIGTEMTIATDARLSGDFSIRMTALNDGGFVIVYLNNSFHICIDRFDAEGHILNNLVLDTTSEGYLDIETLSNGNFALLNWDMRPYGDSILYFTPDGNPTGLSNTPLDPALFAPGTGINPSSISALKNGGLVAASAYYDPPTDPSDLWHGGIAVQIFDEHNQITSTHFLELSVASACPVGVATLENGDFIVSWAQYVLKDGDRSSNANTPFTDLYAQRFSADGTPLSIEPVKLNVVPMSLDVQTVAALSDGGYVISYYSADNLGGTNIYMSRFDQNDVPLFQDIQINTTREGVHNLPYLINLPDGGYVLSWSGNGEGDSTGIFSERYDAEGNLFTTIEGNATASNKITWSGSSAVVLKGGLATDTFLGASGNDDLYGYAGNDSLNGGAGDDQLFAGSGNDVLVGGLGMDTANYAESSASINVNLSKGTARGIDIGTDKLSQVENAVGGNGNDTLTANSKGSELTGGNGNDSLLGGKASDILYAGNGNDKVIAGSGNDFIIGGDGAGNDTYDGGSGIDTVKYTSATDAITVNLNLLSSNATSTLGGDAAGIGTDKLLNIENVIAGNFDDTLIGNRFNNRFEGGYGNDSLNGGLGNDTLIGGEGSDTFVFNSKLSAKSNVDTITDFNHVDDTIQLSKSVMLALGASGVLDSNAFYAAAGATKGVDTFDRIIYNTTSGALYYDADGTGSGAAIQIALLGTTTHPTGIDNTDFMII